MFGIFIIVLLALVAYRILTGLNSTQEVRGNQHRLLDNLHFSSQEFYTSVENELIAQSIPGLDFSRITYAEGGIFSCRREYLRIKRKEYAFDVCAAPFGKGTFVSWWLGEIDTPYRNYLARIPFIGQFFLKRTKTYFELDNEAMFKESVVAAIQRVIQEYSEFRGLRVPTNRLEVANQEL